jgi:hypothetical protein
MRLNNWDKGQVHRAFPHRIHKNFIYQDTALILRLYCRKITLIHVHLYLNEIIKLYDYHLIASYDLDLQLVPQSSTGKTCERGTRKTIFLSMTIYNKNLSSQCNLTVQIEQVQDKCIYMYIDFKYTKLQFSYKYFPFWLQFYLAIIKFPPNFLVC